MEQKRRRKIIGGLVCHAENVEIISDEMGKLENCLGNNSTIDLQ